MDEWGFTGQDTRLTDRQVFVGLGKSVTSIKFKSKRSFVRDERSVLSNPHSSWLDVVDHFT